MADELHLELIEQGPEHWNRWREENPHIRPDLSGAYLFEAQLMGINLGGADLSRACLIGANLKQANLYDANLQNAYANEVNLEDANLYNANLTRANLSEARLIQTNLSKTNAEGANLAAANLTGVCLESWQINRQTDLTDTQCDYLYQKHPQDDRYPQDGSLDNQAFQAFLQRYYNEQDDALAPALAPPPQSSSASATDLTVVPSADMIASMREESLALDAEEAGNTAGIATDVDSEATVLQTSTQRGPVRLAAASTAPKPAASTPLPSANPTTAPSPTRQSRVSLRQWQLMAGAGLLGFLLLVGALIALLLQVLGSRGLVGNPALVSGTEVRLDSLPCNELPPPDIQSQEPSFRYANGVQFYGQFEDGVPVDGRGIMVFENGDRYDGEFQTGERNGCGTFTFTSGRRYMGQFESDQFHGVGIWQLETGERYVGQFRDNKCTGWGTFLFTDGSSPKSGTWENGNLVGDNLSCNRGIISEPEQTVPQE